MIFSISNQKGGVGKTTTAINLSFYLAELGKKVLLIDFDPQSNTTSGLGIQTKESDYINSYGLMLDEASLDVEKIYKYEKNQNLYVIPSTIDLAGAEIELVSAISRETILRKRLKDLKNMFEFILIDCPPSLGLLTLNSLVASDYVLIPVQAEYFALEGLSLLVDTINLVKTDLNANLDVGGVILTMYDQRTNLSKDIYSEINKFFSKKLFSTVIPRNVKLSESQSHGIPIAIYSPHSTGAMAFKDLAMEFVRRFDNLTLLNPLSNRK